MMVVIRFIMKALNPAIWLLNMLRYFGHLESRRDCSRQYEPYDFENDWGYF